MIKKTDNQAASLSPDNSRDRTGNLFVIGSRRSGTTWTLSLLADHPELVGVLHTNIITTFKELGAWWDRRDPYHNTILGSSEEKANLRDLLIKDDFFDGCRRISDLVLDKAFEIKPQAKFVVESQPENIDHLELLGELYPSASILHVIRDPRAVFASWKAAAKSWSSKEVFNTHPVQFCNRWRREISAARELSSGSKRYREVQYEALKDQGVSTLVEICSWLGVSASEQTAQTSLEANSLGNMRKKEIMPQHFFRKGQKRGWRSELSNAEIHCIEYLLSDLMDELGYERLNKGVVARPGIVWRYELARNVYRKSAMLLPSKFSKFLRNMYVR